MKTRNRIVCLALVALGLHAGVAAGPPDLSEWRAEAIAKVASLKTTPRSAVLRKAKGEVRMEVAIDGNGMITDYRMIESSGEAILDREADLIILRVGSFGSPPGRQAMRIIVPLRW